MKALAALSLLVSTQAVLSADYILDLSGYSVGDAVDGIEGWTQSVPNYVDPGDSTVYPRGFVTQVGSSNAIGLGGYYDSDPNAGGSPAVYLQHDLGFTTLSLDKSSMSFDFAVVDSGSFDPDRNQFSIGYYDSSGDELISAVFRPASQSSDPGLTTALWNVYWSTGGVMSATPAFAIAESGFYSLSLDTLAAGSDVGFRMRLSSGVNSQSTTGSLTGLAGTDLSALKIGFIEDGTEDPVNGGGGGYGENFIALNNLVVTVPEPSSLLLCAGSVMTLLFARRRSA